MEVCSEVAKMFRRVHTHTYGGQNLKVFLPGFVNPFQSEIREQEMYIFEQMYFNREQ